MDRSNKRRNILVIGATGKQGGALVRNLLVLPPPSGQEEWHVYALTRNANGRPAQQLLEYAAKHHATGRMHLVEGDLGSGQESMRGVFQTAAAGEEGGDGLWGVYVAIAFPGLGTKDESERDQGIMLADLGLEFHVQVFIYSSALQPDPGDQTVEYSRLMKRDVEKHCKTLGERGLNWVILQPGFFMENFDGLVGSIAVTLFQAGLRKDTTIALIASEDIGRVAARVFANPEPYIHKTIGLTSEAVTPIEIAESYQRATGTTMSRIPLFVGRLLLWLNADARVVLEDLERHQNARRDGLFEGYEEEVRLGQSVCKLQTFEEWVRSRQESSQDAPDGWNKVSVWKLLTGRS
ncbi:NAD(P)-binding protein [Echria macrotheca]|uniref:NAD(P)-binding protein n=1 Tax=Echria macrotheca TaxID=438768 RepID=A0AAJ0BBZ0_9PEZI|nr:NAD(P)-binding protein [Echria macrotheca]